MFPSNRLLVLLACGLLACTAAVSVSAQDSIPIPGARVVLPSFQPIMQQLYASSVPVILPTEVLSTEHPYLRFTNSSSYEISLDSTANCSGAGYCNNGILAGESINQNTPSIQSTYSYQTDPKFRYTGRSSEQSGVIKLSRNIQGYFASYVCGAYCGNSQITWDQGGYRYTVGLRAAPKTAVMDLANSAIENQR